MQFLRGSGFEVESSMLGFRCWCPFWVPLPFLKNGLRLRRSGEKDRWKKPEADVLTLKAR